MLNASQSRNTDIQTADETTWMKRKMRKLTGEIKVMFLVHLSDFNKLL